MASNDALFAVCGEVVMRRFLILVLLVLAGEAFADEPVDLELVLLADASRSIDEVEVRLQRRGYAAAITHPDVLSAIAGGYLRRIAVTYVEWGDETSQEVVVPWTIVESAESAAAFARELLAAPRLGQGPNAIGSAIAAAHALIEMNAIEGTRRVIDFSGDSAYSGGGVPVAVARKAALDAGIVINGLAIYCEDCSGRPVGYDLEGAYAQLIIGGPGSFVITADGNLRFAEAVRRKLLLEIARRPHGKRTPEAAGAPREPGRISPDA
jgi:hypothetical protein